MRIGSLRGAREGTGAADRAEKWLYQISVEIEQKFRGIDDRHPSQPPVPQVFSGQKR
jgi:hypothetical protein